MGVGALARAHDLLSWLRGRPWAHALVMASVFLLAPVAWATPPFEMPRVDQEPTYERGRDVLRAAAVATPRPGLGRLGARRLSARRRGEQRAIRMLHRWVDDALSRVPVPARVAARVHRVVDRTARVVGTRALVEGGAVVAVEVPAQALRRAGPQRGVPWGR